MMLADELQSMGLTRNEAKIYVAILNKGSVKVSAILKDADIATGKVYDVLEGMRRKGLISIVIRNNVKMITACPPSRILDLLDRRGSELEDARTRAKSLMPSLTMMYSSQAQDYEFEVFTGNDGLRVATRKLLAELKADERILCLAVAGRSVSVEGVWREFARVALKKRCAFRFITPRSKATAKNLWLFHELHAQYRIADLPTISPITITKRYVLINDYPSASHILIKSPTVVKIFSAMFDSMWSSGIE